MFARRKKMKLANFHHSFREQKINMEKKKVIV
jgi:hypothetical protein